MAILWIQELLSTIWHKLIINYGLKMGKTCPKDIGNVSFYCEAFNYKMRTYSQKKSRNLGAPKDSENFIDWVVNACAWWDLNRWHCGCLICFCVALLYASFWWSNRKVVNIWHYSYISKLWLWKLLEKRDLWCHMHIILPLEVLS